MNLLSRAKPLFIVLIIFCFTSHFTWAQQSSSKSIDKNQAAQMAKAKYKGRILKVDQDKQRYRVKMLQKTGRVVSVDVDKRSGQVSPSQKKKGN